MITGYFGLPGSGKSSFLAMIAKKYQKKGYRVFCMADSPVDGCYLLSWSDLGLFDVSNSVILIDEISLRADNRDYKRFSESVKKFMILHRHYHCDIVWFTQQYDGVDRKIRELTTCLFYVRSLGSISYAVRINRFIFVHREQKQIMTGYKLCGLFSCLFGLITGSVQVCFRSRYYRYFDSFECDSLPVKEFELFSVSL